MWGIYELLFEKTYQPIYGPKMKTQTQKIKERRGKEKENHITLTKHKSINDHGSRVEQSCIYKIRWGKILLKKLKRFN